MKNFMSFFLIILAIAIGTAAFMPKQAKTIKLELSVEDVQTTVDALAKLPYEKSAGVIQSIISQAQKQMADTTKPKKN